MRDEEITVILSQRGYKRVESPDGSFRTWLWVAPDREGDVIATKLCQGWLGNISPEDVHWMLDFHCELKGSYWTDEQRAKNEMRMSVRRASDGEYICDDH